jgi:hypothetical protein
MSSFDQFKAKQLVKQMAEALAELNSMLSQPPAPVVQAKPVQPAPVQQPAKFLPPDVEHFVDAEEYTDDIILVPKHFLQPKDFDVVKGFSVQHGGKYVAKGDSKRSDGKPYWIISKKQGGA